MKRQPYIIDLAWGKKGTNKKEHRDLVSSKYHEKASVF